MFLLGVYRKVLQVKRRFTVTMAYDVSDGIMGHK